MSDHLQTSEQIKSTVSRAVIDFENVLPYSRHERFYKGLGVTVLKMCRNCAGMTSAKYATELLSFGASRTPRSSTGVTPCRNCASTARTIAR